MGMAYQVINSQCAGYTRLIDEMSTEISSNAFVLRYIHCKDGLIWANKLRMETY